VFGVLYGPEGTSLDALTEIAREFSPRIERYVSSDRYPEVSIDLNGVTRLFGDARATAEQLRRTAADRGVRVRVAIAGTCTAARLLARHRAGITVIEPGTEAAALAPLPIALLGVIGAGGDEGIQTFRRWGLRTLGDLAALPPDDLVARLGKDGAIWHGLARGEDRHPLVQAVPEERFEQSLDLEWPIDALEPLSFVLGRLLEPLSSHLERRDRGAAVLHVRLHLVKMGSGDEVLHERSLQLPIPMRDARTLRTLILLDLESHPPAGPVDRVTVAVDPTPGRIVQFSLLTRPLPSPEQLSTLMARLQALVGETRCGSPARVDSWQPGAFLMKPFAPVDAGIAHIRNWPPSSARVAVALRRFRHPVPIRVQVDQEKPVSLTIMRRGLTGGRVESCAGPWRTSGRWWEAGVADWDRDEWDVALTRGETYRVFRDRQTDTWFLEGIVD